MKYLIISIILSIAIFITINGKREVEGKGHKWEDYKGKKPNPYNIAKVAITKYNKEHTRKYYVRKIYESQKAISKEKRIRVFFIACNTTKSVKPKRKPHRKNKKMIVKCAKFRATLVNYTSKGEGGEIKVKYLDEYF